MAAAGTSLLPDSVRFVDTTLRDGLQSLWASWISPDLFRDVAPLIDRAGFCHALWMAQRANIFPPLVLQDASGAIDVGELERHRQTGLTERPAFWRELPSPGLVAAPL